MWFSIVIFFLISLGLGYTILDSCKTKAKDPITRFIEILGTGVAAFSFLSIIFWLLHIPIRPTAYLLVALVYPLFKFVSILVKNKKFKLPFKKSESWQLLLKLAIILIILISFFSVYHKGTFAYPYLENDDPWHHAQGAKYIATTGSVNQQFFKAETGAVISSYLEPYPPTYDAMMGLLLQSNDDIAWTLKFFNVLLITLGLAFYYLFAKEFWKDDWKGIFTMFILATLPSFMSHFIWSQTLALAIFPMAFYAYLRSLEEKKWVVPAAIIIGSMLVTQPVVSFFFGLVILLHAGLVLAKDLLGKKRKEKKKKNKMLWPRALLVGASGVGVSLLFWGSQVIKMSVGGIFRSKGGEISGGSGWSSSYALQKYTLQEVLFPPHSSRIDQAIGWGWVLVLILVITIAIIIFKYRRTLNINKEWRFIHLFVWFGFLFYLVFAQSFGLQGWGSSRVWPYLAIPLALLVAEGVFILAKSISKNTKTIVVIVLLCAVLIGATSIPAKVAVQTATWPPGVDWGNPQLEIPGFIQMEQTLPKDSRVFPFCSVLSHVIGFNMYVEAWNVETHKFHEEIINKTGEEILNFLHTHKYEYVIIDTVCINKYGNKTEGLIEKIQGSATPIINKQGFLLVKVI
ncbi:hypothetical protein GOV10_05805 [Candidatus Woesearchaeota archaeon]|nr:hypothetical protein [Candidatus Woesearchaeota archaeon]